MDALEHIIRATWKCQLLLLITTRVLFKQKIWKYNSTQPIIDVVEINFPLKYHNIKEFSKENLAYITPLQAQDMSVKNLSPILSNMKDSMIFGLYIFLLLLLAMQGKIENITIAPESQQEAILFFLNIAYTFIVRVQELMHCDT